MSSFYGGKQGRSYRIVEHYDSVQDMVAKFREGNNYTDVGYGEYVIIDTIINRNSKSDPENGLLYRRGNNFSQPYKESGPNEVHTAELAYKNAINTDNEETARKNFINVCKSYFEAPGGGAVYVGQIVGPQGDSPAVKVMSWSDFIESDADKKHTGIMDRVPGYNPETDEYHDDIDYGFYTVKDAAGNVIGADIAFNFPYTTFDFTAQDIRPYNLPSNLITEIIDDPDNPHPYHKKYEISIPHGIHGRSVVDVGIYQYNKQTGEYSKYTSEIIDGNTPDLYFGYTLESYEEDDENPEKTFVKFPFKVLKGLRRNHIVKEDGTSYRYAQSLTPLFTNGAEGDIEGKPIEYNVIESVDVDNNKTVTITLSNGSSVSYTPREVTDIKRNSEGNIEVYYNNNTALTLPVTEMANIKYQGDHVLIGFRNLNNPEKLFPDSMISQEGGLTYIDLGGVIKGQHILRNYERTQDLPAGGLDGDHKGWLVTVGTPETGYDLYAYDYNDSNPGWYSIQHVDTQLMKPEWSILLAEEDENGKPVNHSDADLLENGIWLIKEKKPNVLNIHINQQGEILDIDNNIVLTKTDLANKVNNGDKVQASFDADGSEEYKTVLTIERYSSDYVWFTGIINNTLSRLLWESSGELRITSLIEF